MNWGLHIGYDPYFANMETWGTPRYFDLVTYCRPVLWFSWGWK